jgi:NIPSNAP
MITLAIHYTLDPNKLADFEAYVGDLPPQIERAGGTVIGYYLPTKIAGPTNAALGLIGFADLTSYQRYRDKLGCDPAAVANVRRAEQSGCIVNEDRAIVRRFPDQAT